MSLLTAIAPVNIAVVKYWGKRNEELILPLNDSISVSLCMDQMCAKTTVMASPTFTENRMWLNGKEESFDNPRLTGCLEEVLKRLKEESKTKPALEEKLNWKVHVCSKNNFPTAAGLASSAAGYACLAYSLGQVFGVSGDMSKVARLGSGSACRSVFGGFVQWLKGSQDDGSDSYAVQLAPASHWPTLRILVLVVNGGKKKTGSTIAMQRSVKTSDLLKHRVSHSIPRRTQDMIKAIENKDFETFAEITMKESNQMHSVTLDTYPPTVYLTDVSHAIIDLVHLYNKLKGATKVAYTFDAGPNACLFLEEADVPEVLALIKNNFPPSKEEGFLVRSLSNWRPLRRKCRWARVLSRRAPSST